MNEPVLHTILIYGHALGGLAAFGLGCFVLRPSLGVESAKGESAVFRTYFLALWVMVLLLVAVVGFDWRGLPPVSRFSYGALTLLAFYTGVRGVQAWRLLHKQSAGWKGLYIGHVGFTLISLFDGFVVVGALDMNAPGWFVGAVGVLGVVIGISAVNYVKGRAARPVGVAAPAGTP